MTTMNTTPTQQHTPTPWTAKLTNAVEADTPAVFGPHGYNIAKCYDFKRHSREANNANAAFIVRAVNSHAALVAALKVARAALEANGWAHDVPNTMREIREALDQAKA